jgi:hypothetical protein
LIAKADSGSVIISHESVHRNIEMELDGPRARHRRGPCAIGGRRRWRAAPLLPHESGADHRSWRLCEANADAARARLKYDVDGAPVEAWITAVSMAQTSPSGDGHGGRRYDNRAIMLMAMRAPAGQLEANERLFTAVRGSIHLEPDWTRQFLAVVDQLSAAQQ